MHFIYKWHRKKWRFFTLWTLPQTLRWAQTANTFT
jgi:hypothetical protein